jgi:hypothetical protein
MFLPTEDLDKADEDLDIPFLLLAQYHGDGLLSLISLYKGFYECALTLVKDCTLLLACRKAGKRLNQKE